MKESKSVEFDDPYEVARQLQCPSGTRGIAMGELMDRTNINMTLNTAIALQLKAHERILEIGHGNCSHLDKILALAEHVKYHGLEISELMLKEAIGINGDKGLLHKSDFKLYDGEHIPYNNGFFKRS